MKTKENLLVTGGAGFIGSNFINRILDDDINITVLDNLSTGKIHNISKFKKKSNFTFHEIDLFSDDIDDYFQGINKVFHFAANPDVKIDD
jgi:UDP-glucose 4-epimerase